MEKRTLLDWIVALGILVIVTIFCLIIKCNDANAQDSTIAVTGNWDFGIDAIPFGTVIKASEEPNTQLEAELFLGAGITSYFKFKKTIGLGFPILFYQRDEKVYPMFGPGIILFPIDKITVSLQWDFGKINGTLPAWQERLKLLASYKIPIIK